jgi:hypothetical protein
MIIIHLLHNLKDYFKITLERRVTICPTIVEIPNNAVNGVDKAKNINKLMGMPLRNIGYIFKIEKKLLQS